MHDTRCSQGRQCHCTNELGANTLTRLPTRASVCLVIEIILSSRSPYFVDSTPAMHWVDANVH